MVIMNSRSWQNIVCCLSLHRKVALLMGILPLHLKGLTWALLSLALLAVSHARAENSEEQVYQEIEIVAEILETSLKQNARNTSLEFALQSSHFLPNQGALFLVKRGNKNPKRKSEWTSSYVAVRPSSIKSQHTYTLILYTRKQEYLKTVEQIGNLYKQLRALKKDKSLLKQGLDKQILEQDSTPNKVQEVVATPLELNNQIAQLNETIKQNEDELQRLQNLRNEIIAEQLVLDEQQQALSVKVVSSTVADMLCVYGAGLKSLSDDKYVSFVLTDFRLSSVHTLPMQGNSVFVFNKADILSCVANKITSVQLMDRAEIH